MNDGKIQLSNNKILRFIVGDIFGNIINSCFLWKSLHVTDAWTNGEWSEVQIKEGKGEKEKQQSQ